MILHLCTIKGCFLLSRGKMGSEVFLSVPGSYIEVVPAFLWGVSLIGL
ncbi:hypothetical protein STHERM_c03540 [Spirochaeta thermophila DSM 6192]|uniref:Uncharacterized protein n=1 Tax=Winmispira thermophila (strain ATCC 49972 / DSM 6192 / RI 19.B1) TaxID=665571 RepID=E0RPD3_WINT6|nr:hypothetical protein STHERM_c03540 [Spirochaeta thermophila DSM 6192]